MGQFKALMEDLTFTDGVADARLIRDRTQTQPFSETAWNYEKTLMNLFMKFSESEHGSVVTNTKLETLVHMKLDVWNQSKEKAREDCAFLVAKVLLNRKKDAFVYTPNWRDLSGDDYNYIYAFGMELLLPEEGIRALINKHTVTLNYADAMVNYGVTVETVYNRMKDLDLL